MRRLVPLLLLALVLAACPAASEDTTTTTPPVQPSTTSTTAPSTTTTEPATTTTEEECVDRDGDGLLRTRRGFVCPPYLRPYELTDTGFIENIADIHLPGTYTLRLFRPAVSFTRTERSRSYGENPELVEYDSPRDGRHIISGAAHESLATFPDAQPWSHPDHYWKTDVVFTDATVGGYPATITRFTADCPDPYGRDNTPICVFDLEGLPLGWVQVDGQGTAVVVVDLPDGVFTIVVESPTGLDDYWTETVEPFLDSIEFIDQ